MNKIRNISNNIRWLLDNNNISQKEFCNNLNYSKEELDKLLDGRLAIFSNDINDIAKFFNTNVDNIVSYFPERDNLREEFKFIDNKEKILDIFDMYCNLKEIVG